jgi:restriction system protein
MSATIKQDDRHAIWMSLRAGWHSWRRHGFRRLRAGWSTAQLTTIGRKDSPREALSRRIQYLRQLDPFVFEEVVLDTFQRHGWIVIRNRRYTGDGGIDGRVYNGGHWYGVQCKRIAGDVLPHVLLKFEKDLKKNGLRKGFFVHTGRLAATAFENTPPCITVISPPQVVQWIGSSLPGFRK